MSKKKHILLYLVCLITFAVFITVPGRLCIRASLAQTPPGAKDGKTVSPAALKEETLKKTAGDHKSDALRETDENVKKKPETIEKDALKSGNKEAEKKKEQPQDPAGVKDKVLKDEKNLSDEGLLFISEGAFKYKRIPEITISDKGPFESVNQKEEAVPPTGDEKEQPGEKGLLGLSRSATDLLAKLGLIGIIVLVFVMYRMRNRNRRSSVLKRFPKA